MSPNQGRRGRSGKGGGSSARDPAATRRLGLVVFGLAFLALFVIVAIAEGIGDPSIPSGDIVLVEDVPGDIGEVSKEELDHAIELQATNAEESVPKPGSAKYEEVKEAALNALFESIWLQGLAAEEGIEATEREIAKERKKLEEESFSSKAELRKFLKESGFTDADVEERVVLQIYSNKLQALLKERSPTPTKAEIENYYEAAKASQFTQKPSLEVRLIVNKNRKKVEEAAAALSKDNSAKNWNKVAAKYSEDPQTKGNGGLQKEVQEGATEEPLDAAYFNAPEGQLEGPIKAPQGYTLFEVLNSTPESVQELKAVESQIQTTLAQQLEQEYLQGYVGVFSNTWTQRTFCAPGYVTERCANFEKSGHPSTAPEACYEANPKGGRPEACPAPVFQLVPALPGTVTPLEPKGKPLAQRPLPLPGAEEGGEEGAAGLPEGAVPPEEAPPEEAPPEEAPPEAEAPSESE